ncbi:MAG: nitroreductase family protein [Muribaculaceae bacterium]|nr:nitroreductase family protein [Muribaculaceae bacterium]
MTQDYFLSRRSCRNFSSEKIAPEKLEEMLLKASKAPTCGNMQLYSVVVTSNEENRKRLASFHFNQPAAAGAPVILTICADFNRFTHWCEINNADAGFDNFHSFITALTDAVIYAQQITTIAEQEGLGTCYLGTVTYNAKEISELLDLPNMVVPVASLAIGWPNEKGEKTGRLPSSAFIHEEKYRSDRKEDIRKFFEIHDLNPDNNKFIKENGKENLAQVFSEVRYPREMNEKVSESFYQLLKEKNFIKD